MLAGVAPLSDGPGGTPCDGLIKSLWSRTKKGKHVENNMLQYGYKNGLLRLTVSHVFIGLWVPMVTGVSVMLRMVSVEAGLSNV